jgi:FkbM family methyltransferase
MSNEVVTTPFGKFLIDPEYCIGTTTKAGTLWDGPGFLQVIVDQYLIPGTTVIDVGANIGTFTVYCCSHGARRVIAVEAVPMVMQRLKANLDLNQELTADKVIPIEHAAWEDRAQLQMTAFDPHNWGGTALVADPAGTIVGVPLDSFAPFFGERVSLIKLDVQGCELRALWGLEQTIRRHRPVLVFEWEADLAAAHGDTLRDVTDWIESLDLKYAIHPWPSQVNNYLAVAR